MSTCVVSHTTKYKSRPSPPYPANLCPVGQVKLGNNGMKWIVKQTKNGVHRWSPMTGSEKKETKPMTTSDIKMILDRRGIKYKKSMKKSQLMALLKQSDPSKNHKVSLKKWYSDKVSPTQLKKVIGFEAITQRDITTEDLLQQFDSMHQYQAAKRGEDDVAGWQIMGKKSKFYVQKYPF